MLPFLYPRIPFHPILLRHISAPTTSPILTLRAEVFSTFWSHATSGRVVPPPRMPLTPSLIAQIHSDVLPVNSLPVLPPPASHCVIHPIILVHHSVLVHPSSHSSIVVQFILQFIHNLLVHYTSILQYPQSYFSYLQSYLVQTSPILRPTYCTNNLVYLVYLPQFSPYQLSSILVLPNSLLLQSYLSCTINQLSSSTPTPILVQLSQFQLLVPRYLPVQIHSSQFLAVYALACLPCLPTQLQSASISFHHTSHLVQLATHFIQLQLELAFTFHPISIFHQQCSSPTPINKFLIQQDFRSISFIYLEPTLSTPSVSSLSTPTLYCTTTSTPTTTITPKTQQYLYIYFCI